MTMYHFDVV